MMNRVLPASCVERCRWSWTHSCTTARQGSRKPGQWVLESGSGRSRVVREPTRQPAGKVRVRSVQAAGGKNRRRGHQLTQQGVHLGAIWWDRAPIYRWRSIRSASRRMRGCYRCCSGPVVELAERRLSS
jgi:hypothetical protein